MRSRKSDEEKMDMERWDIEGSICRGKPGESEVSCSGQEQRVNSGRTMGW